MGIDWVICPICRGKRGKCCDDRGVQTRGAALLYVDLFLKTDDTTQAQQNELVKWAKHAYAYDARAPKPRTALDDALDALGIP